MKIKVGDIYKSRSGEMVVESAESWDKVVVRFIATGYTATAIGLIIAVGLVGCNSESKSAVDKPQPEPPQEQYGSVNPVYIGDIIEPIPATPIVPSEPVKPTMPIFVPEGISTITQQPYSGTNYLTCYVSFLHCFS